MNEMLKAIIHDMKFNELRIALLGIALWIQNGVDLNLKDFEEIIDEAKRE